jgi:hypothetical protein
MEDGNDAKNLFWKEYVDTTKFREDLNKSFLGYRTEASLRRATFFKDIATLSVAILGLLPLGLEKGFGGHFLLAALIIYAVVIFLVMSRKMAIWEKYATAKDFSSQAFDRYVKELQNTEGVQKLKAEVKKMRSERAGRGKEMDYFGELLIFLFSTATLLVVISLLNYRPSFLSLTSSIIGIFYLSFSPFYPPFARIVSQIATFMKKPV